MDARAPREFFSFLCTTTEEARFIIIVILNVLGFSGSATPKNFFALGRWTLE